MTSSTSPLLQPPPIDITDHTATRQWMQNLYAYIFQLTLQTTSTSATSIASTAVTDFELSTSTAGSVTLATYNSSGTLLDTQTITGV